MNNLSEEDPVNVGKLYLILRCLVSIYIKAYIELNEEFLSEEGIEELSSDIASYMLVDKKIYLNRTHKFFWWIYISKVVKAEFKRNKLEREFKSLLQHLLNDPLEQDLYKRTNKNFFRLTDLRLNDLILKGDLFPVLLEVQKADSELPEYVVGIVKDKLKTVSTKKLLNMYKRLTIRYVKEHRKCREKVHQMFYRDRPRRV